MTPSRDALPFSGAVRSAMIVMNFIPLLHLAIVVFVAWRLGVIAAILALYILPPCVSRLGGLVFPQREGHFPGHSREFLSWWFHACCQTLFVRLPIFDEILRIVPSLYSFWLRLWGSQIGSITYWAPGVVVLDRGLLRIGDRVVIGAGARLTSHLMHQGEDKNPALAVGRIRIGTGALIGGYSIIGPGTEVARGETVSATTILPPFSKWKGGRRTRRIAR